ncbi:MAG: Nif3-like dinuclear metal center hexameric protein [Solirubrobacterales bacterium]
MPLKVKDIHNILEKHAPSIYKESYDNVGLMVGSMEDEVTSILLSLDCTLEVIEEAKLKGCNLILCHHPLLFKKPSSITTGDLLGKKIIELISNNINVYASHTNLDSVSGGLNDILIELLGFNSGEIIEPNPFDERAGIGRLVSLSQPLRLEELCINVKKSLSLPIIRYAGNDDMQISKIAVINGSGQSCFSKAASLGADCIITGDTSYHYISDMNEEGIAVIDAGHHGTEILAVKSFSNWFKNKINDMGFNNSVLFTENNNCPYKYK